MSNLIVIFNKCVKVTQAHTMSPSTSPTADSKDKTGAVAYMQVEIIYEIKQTHLNERKNVQGQSPKHTDKITVSKLGGS